MRRSFSLLLLPVLALAAWSDSGRPAVAAELPAPDPTSAHHARLTLEQHFSHANLAHDGHLTLEEAKAGYAPVAKHFEEIDADHKGYVTQNDIRAWRIMKKAAHRLTQPPEDRLKPRNAMHVFSVGHNAVTASAMQTVAVSSAPPPRPDREVDTD